MGAHPFLCCSLLWCLYGSRGHLLVVLPWLVVGGADKVALDIVSGLAARGWGATIVLAEHPHPGIFPAGNVWLPKGRAAAASADVIVTTGGHLPKHVFGELVCYLIRTRRIDAILMSNVAAPYLFLPYIVRYCSVKAIIDLNHNWSDDWIDGGFTTLSIGMTRFIDRSIYISESLRRKMEASGADKSVGKVRFVLFLKHFVTLSAIFDAFDCIL